MRNQPRSSGGRVVVAACVAVLCAGLLAPLARAATLSLESEAWARRGHPTTLVARDDDAPLPGVDVYVTYAPGSEVSERALLGRTDDAGRVGWTPARGGVVTVEAWRPHEVDPDEGCAERPGDDGELAVRAQLQVRYPSPPGGALAMLTIAGTILLGGLFLSVRYARA